MNNYVKILSLAACIATVIYIYKINSTVETKVIDKPPTRQNIVAVSNELNEQRFTNASQNETEQLVASENTHSLQKYQDMSDQEILIDLIKQSKTSRFDITNVLFKLIRHGIIDPNTPMREGGNSSHYIPLFAAMQYDKQFSKEKLRLFLELGTSVFEPKPAWASIMAKKVEDIDMLNMLIEQGAIEQDQGLMLLYHSIGSKNTLLANHILTSDQNSLTMNFDSEYLELTSEIALSKQKSLIRNYNHIKAKTAPEIARKQLIEYSIALKNIQKKFPLSENEKSIFSEKITQLEQTISD